MVCFCLQCVFVSPCIRCSCKGVWMEYVGMSNSPVLRHSPRAFKYFSISLAVCVWLMGRMLAKHSAAEYVFTLKLLFGQVPADGWGYPLNTIHLTLPWHPMQRIYLLFKDSYWKQNEVGIGQCWGVGLPVHHWWRDFFFINGTMRCQLISLPDTRRVQKLVSTSVAIQVNCLHLLHSQVL